MFNGHNSKIKAPPQTEETLARQASLGDLAILPNEIIAHIIETLTIDNLNILFKFRLINNYLKSVVDNFFLTNPAWLTKKIKEHTIPEVEKLITWAKTHPQIGNKEFRAAIDNNGIPFYGNITKLLEKLFFLSAPKTFIFVEQVSRSPIYINLYNRIEKAIKASQGNPSASRNVKSNFELIKSLMTTEEAAFLLLFSSNLGTSIIAPLISNFTHTTYWLDEWEQLENTPLVKKIINSLRLTTLLLNRMSALNVFENWKQHFNNQIKSSSYVNASGSKIEDIYIDLTMLNLTGVNFQNATIKCSLSNSILVKANFTNASLPRSLQNADLTEAILRNANLKDTDITNSTLTYADLSGAFLENIIFLELDIDPSSSLETNSDCCPLNINLDHPKLNDLLEENKKTILTKKNANIFLYKPSPFLLETGIYAQYKQYLATVQVEKNAPSIKNQTIFKPAAPSIVSPTAPPMLSSPKSSR